MSSCSTPASRRSSRSRHHHSVAITFSNLKSTPYKSHTGLQNNATNTSKVLRQNGVNAVPVGVDNANGLRAYLNRNGDQLTHVVIQALWLKTADLSAMCQAFPSIEFVVVVHSGFKFLEDETAATPLLYQTMDLAAQLTNLQVASNSSRMCADLSNLRGQPVTYLPNLYPTDFLMPAPQTWNGGVLRAALFCSPRPGKNMTNQAAAFGIMCRRLKTQGILYYNEGRADGGVTSSAKRIINNVKNTLAGNPYVTLEGKPWSPMSQHVQVLGSCNLSFQCSDSETFNLLTCDGIAMGIPTITSPCVTWTPSYWQAQPDNATDIARVATSLLYNPQAPYDGVEALQQHNAQSVHAWFQYVAQGLSGVGANMWPSPKVPLRAQGRRVAMFGDVA